MTGGGIGAVNLSGSLLFVEEGLMAEAGAGRSQRNRAKARSQRPVVTG